MRRILKISKLLDVLPVRVVEVLGNLSEDELKIFAVTDLRMLALAHFRASTSRKKAIILERWEAVSFLHAQSANTIPALKRVWSLCPSDGPTEDFVLQKWCVLSLREVEKANTISKLKWACDRAPSGSDAEDLAILKIALLTFSDE